MSSTLDMLPNGSGFITYFERMPLGRPIGSKRGMVTTKCPKCGAPSWKKSAREYVHVSKTELLRNEPVVDSLKACELTKHEAMLAEDGKPLTSIGAK